MAHGMGKTVRHAVFTMALQIVIDETGFQLRTLV